MIRIIRNKTTAKSRPLLCHTFGISNEGLLCLAASSDYFDAKDYRSFSTTYLYTASGKLIDTAQAAYIGIEELSCRFGREIESCYSYRGYMQLMHVLRSLQEIPDLLDEISGSHLIEIKVEPIKELFWITSEEIQPSIFSSGECIIQFNDESLSWSSNLLALIANEELRTLIKDVTKPMECHYEVSSRKIELNILIPFCVRTSDENAFLFVRSRTGLREYSCEYFSTSNLTLKKGDDLVSIATLPESGYYLPKFKRNGDSILLPNFKKEFVGQIGTVIACSSIISPTTLPTPKSNLI